MGIIYKNGIPYGNQPSIDATLTHQGEAADAKATGDAISDVKNTLNHKADVIYDTASGDIASFPDGADGMPVKALTVGIEPVQDTSGGDPSPTHICPISGWTGCNVSRTGFNVWDEEWEVGDYDDSGNKRTNNSRIRCKDLIPVRPNTSYWFYMRTTSGLGFQTYNVDKNPVNYGNRAAGGGGFLITTADNEYYLTFGTWDAYGNSYKHDICINISDPAKNGTYEPGHVVTIPISWQSEAGTVYGGTLTLNPNRTGTLVVDHKQITINGTEDWQLSAVGAAANCFSIPLTDAIDIGSADSHGFTPVLSEHFKTTSQFVPAGNRANMAFVAQWGNYFNYTFLNIGASDQIGQNVSDFKTWLASNNDKIVYPLASPQPYQLTSEQISGILTTLYGNNNIWADCGPSTVEYPCDTKLYIQKINTPTDDDMIADANIASGQYFIVNNNLYISTAAILAGDPIKPGTNCTLTNLAAALNAINS